MNFDNNFLIPLSNLENTKWYNPLDLDVKFYGFNYINKDKRYTRLPLDKEEKLKEITPKCLSLSYNTSGGQLHFITNSSRLIIHAKISGMAGISGMTFVSQGGFDCYVGKSYDDLLFFDTARFSIGSHEYEYTLFKGLNKEDHLVVINFPLYGCVDDLRIAVDDDSYIKKPDINLSNNQKIVYYGTSITQGGCASRPGLAYINKLSRMMKCEFINFGFSGNAFGENIIAEIMSEIDDATMFVIDYEANGGTNGKLAETLEDFIRTLRSKHPIIPIIVISRIKYLFDDLNPLTLGKRREEIRKYQESLVKRLNKEGDKHLYYINGMKLLGNKYDEYTIDTIHPNDLGFDKMAKSLYTKFNKIIEEEKRK